MNSAPLSSARSRRRLLGAATGLAAAVAAACGGPTSATDKPATGPDVAAVKNAVLEAWCHADTRSAWQTKTLEDYNREKGTNLTVTWTNLQNTGALADKLVVTTASGSGFPDLADVEISQMGKLLKTADPPLVAYNDYLKGRENDFFKPSFVDPWSLNGKYYGLGNELNVVLFAYRWDILDRVGIKPPIRTWDEVADAGKKVLPVAPDGLFFIRGGSTGGFHLLAIPAGGGFLENGSKLTINHPANVKALQLLTDLAQRQNAISLWYGDRPAGDPGDVQSKASQNGGQVAGELGPTWRISGGLRTNAPDTNGKWMVQPLPQWSASGKPLATSQGGTGMTVLKGSKFKDAGIDFVIWEHGTKAVLRDYELRQVWPTYKKAYDDPRLSEPVPWFNNQRVGPVLRDAAETMLPFYQGVWWPEISAGAGKHITAALRGEEPVRQALDQGQADAKAAIEAAGGRVDADGTIRS